MSKKFILSFWLLAVLFNTITTWVAIVIQQALNSGVLVPFSILPDLDFIGLDILFTIIFSVPGIFALMILMWIVKEFIYSVKAAYLLLFSGCSVITIFCYLVMELVLQLNM